MFRTVRQISELGISPGEIIAICAFNSDWYLEWLLAVTYVGGIIAPLNYRWTQTTEDTRTEFEKDIEWWWEPFYTAHCRCHEMSSKSQAFLCLWYSLFFFHLPLSICVASFKVAAYVLFAKANVS
ncbi:uncharacterized protein LOC141658701 [Silene latifolia]|uniref:uncharacterized protein LOC141658701 n=1 Tax=Silene latifolia TaxID=37657 RepID=UPI003D789023